MEELTEGWHHIAAVGSNDKTEYYIDGTYTCVSNAQIKSEVYSIGNLFDGTHNFQFGTIDEVRIWTRVLTAEELKANLNR